MLKELRFALRSIVQAPGFSLTAGLILAIGLGLTMYMFSAINAYILRPLPFPEPDELIHVELSRPAQGEFSLSVSLHDFVDFRRQQSAFKALAGFYMGTVNVGGDERPERFDGAFVTANTFAVLGVRPVMGRSFEPAEEEPGAPAAVILGHQLWRNRYGSDPDIIGHVIRVNGREAAVVGVMPEGFRFPVNEDIWVPLVLDTRTLRRGEGTGLEVFGRLESSASLTQARTQFQTIADGLARSYPETNAGTEVVMKPYAEEFVDDSARTTIYTMFGAVCLVLLIACANVANLILARNSARVGEFSIRAALGAGRGRIIGLILLECLIISIPASALAIWLAHMSGRKTFEIIRSAENFAPPYWVNFEADWRSWSFAVAAALAAALAAGIIPAFKAARMDLNANLRQGSVSVAGNPHARLIRILVTLQIALSCVVLTGGGLMARSVISLRDVDLGADVRNVLTGRIGLFSTSYPEPSDKLRLLEELHLRLASMPQVEAATLSTSLPGTITGYGEISIEGIPPGGQRQFAQVITIAPDYFELFRIPLLEGRIFWSTDRADNPPVAIVNRFFANRYWPGEKPTGKRLRIGPEEGEGAWVTVVGMVPDVVQSEIHQPVRPAVYVPLAQNPPQFISLALRTGVEPMNLAESMRRIVAGLDGDLPVYWLRTLQQAIDLGRFQTNFLASLFSIFAVIGLLLGAVGQYALLAYSVSLRSREIGVRRALGARDKTVVRLLLGQALWQVGIGLAVGLVLSFWSAGLLSSILYGIQPRDPGTFITVVAVLILSTTLASMLPARRALAVDPISVLRHE